MSFQSLFRFEEVAQIIRVCVLFTTKERPLSSYLHREEYAIALVVDVEERPLTS